MNGSSNIAAQLIPSSIRQDNQQMMELARSDPQAFLQQLKTPPPTGGVAGGLASIMPVAGMAKVFKPGPSTVEGYVAHLAKTGETMPSYARSIKSIKAPTGEIFSALDRHPADAAAQAMAHVGKAAGAFDFGFLPAYEGAPHITEALANTLRKSEGVQAVNKLLNQGISIQTIIDMLKQKAIRTDPLSEAAWR